MSRENLAKIRRREAVTSSEMTSAASTAGVQTTEQGRTKDPHAIAAELGRLLKQTITITQ